MAKHVVEVTSPMFELGKADTIYEIFTINDDDSKPGKRRKLGKLCISHGAAVWYPNGATYAKKLTWTQLAKAFDESGTHRAEKKSGGRGSRKAEEK